MGRRAASSRIAPSPCSPRTSFHYLPLFIVYYLLTFLFSCVFLQRTCPLSGPAVESYFVHVAAAASRHAQSYALFTVPWHHGVCETKTDAAASASTGQTQAYQDTPPCPQEPSVIVLEKKTGNGMAFVRCGLILYVHVVHRASFLSPSASCVLHTGHAIRYC
jgi:hypothetical protein